MNDLGGDKTGIAGDLSTEMRDLIKKIIASAHAILD